LEFSKKIIGSLGEDAAAKWYEENGYLIVERNWRCGKIGEIDIIAEKDGVVVFSEVKYRKDRNFAAPSLAVNIKKQNKIRVLAGLYLERITRFSDKFIRFDVAEVFPKDSGKGLCVNIIEDAF
jgi:putative endonuclease